VLDFCTTRKLSVEGIRLRQRWERHPETGLIQTIHQEILLPDDFPEKYLSAVVRASKLCSVKKHLENSPEVVVQATRSNKTVPPTTG